MVRVDLTLTGGHRVQALVHQAAFVMTQLLQSFAAAGPELQPATFGLPTPDGQGTVFVRARDVLSIEIDRIVQPADAEHDDVVSGVFLLQRDVLQPATVAALQQHVLSRQADFRPSTIANTETGHTAVQPTQRVSEVLYNLPLFEALFHDRLHAALPSVCAALALEPFPIGRIECQITAHRDGAFFKRHTDDSGERNAGRRISFVYYFHAEPKPFTGGMLTLYPAGLPPSQVAPECNTMIFFRSAVPHEVGLVRCPDTGPAHARFTVNGWIHGVQSDEIKSD